MTTLKEVSLDVVECDVYMGFINVQKTTEHEVNYVH